MTRLARVGYDHAIGYLKGGIKTWIDAGKEIDSIKSIDPNELSRIVKTQFVDIVDVRKKSEYDSEHLQQAENAPLDEINESMLKIRKDIPTYVHCAGGYRSMIFASILKARGYDNIIDVRGGYQAIKASGKFKTTRYVQPKTQL